MQPYNTTSFELPRAHGDPPASGILRNTPEDFQVEELLGFEPEGEGEHLWLWIEKRDINTDQVARQLAGRAKVRKGEISFAGLKDRRAVTRQWFSVHLVKGEVAEALQWHDIHWRVLHAARARRKLRRGALHGNRFIITLHAVQGDISAIEARLRMIQECGVPNYFGEQRFGHDNIAQAEAMVRGETRVPDPHLRGIYLSALRAAIFNAVLANRVQDGTWCQALAGDAFNLDGSRSFFVADTVDEAITGRLAEHDIHPTGPLWGNGDLPCRDDALARELSVIADCPELWKAACIENGMKQDRRALRVVARNLGWQWLDNDALRVEFSLPAGAYATTVLREILITR